MPDTPEDIRSHTVEQLDELLLKMTSVDWQLDLLEAPPEVAAEAKAKVLQVQQARLRLANAQLHDIHDRLETEEDAILAGCRNVGNTLQHGAKAERVLAAVNGLLGVLGRVVPLV